MQRAVSSEQLLCFWICSWFGGRKAGAHWRRYALVPNLRRHQRTRVWYCRPPAVPRRCGERGHAPRCVKKLMCANQGTLAGGRSHEVPSPLSPPCGKVINRAAMCCPHNRRHGQTISANPLAPNGPEADVGWTDTPVPRLSISFRRRVLISFDGFVRRPSRIGLFTWPRRIHLLLSKQRP